MSSSAHGTGPHRRHVALAVACAAAGLWLAAHHPLSAPVACVLFALWATLAAWRPRAWQFALPALLPVLGLAPWSGWIGVDEFDLAVLASLAGAHAHRAMQPADGGIFRPARLDRALIVLTWCVALAGVLLALLRWDDLTVGIFDGYASPLNAWRVGKAWVWALLLAPHLEVEVPGDGIPAWAAGLAAGAGVSGLAVLWERLAFTGLADTDIYYRTSGLFWEMHVGGAAIEVWLILTLPFAAWLALRGGGAWQRLLGLSAAVLALYAVVTTLSRGLYLAGELALASALWLTWHHRRRADAGRTGASMAKVMIALAVVAGGAWGARGLVRHLEYGTFMFAALGAGLVFGAWRARAMRGWRARAGALAMSAMAVLMVAELGAQIEGSGLQSRRLATAGDDLARRVAHWGRVLSLLRTPGEWLFGLGAGRYPVEIVERTRRVEWPGGYRIVTEGDSTFARVSGPDRIAPLVGVFGLTQRVGPVAGGEFRLRFDARAGHAALLIVGLCEKHLIYESDCEYDAVRVTGGTWRPFEVRIDAARLRGGPWFAPRPVQLSFAAGDLRTGIDVDNVRLVGPDGGERLANGDFSQGGARWLLGGRYYFLPWHPDSLVLELLVERGWLGIALLTVLAARALLARVGARGRDDALAPCVFAALMGVLALGLVSSVMDVPRNATVMLLLLLVRPRGIPPARPGPATSA